MVQGLWLRVTRAKGFSFQRNVTPQTRLLADDLALSRLSNSWLSVDWCGRTSPSFTKGETHAIGLTIRIDGLFQTITSSPCISWTQACFKLKVYQAPSSKKVHWYSTSSFSLTSPQRQSSLTFCCLLIIYTHTHCLLSAFYTLLCKISCHLLSCEISCWCSYIK